MDTSKLKDFRESPYFALFTLAGEPHPLRAQPVLEERSRQLWNLWSCKGLLGSVQRKVAKRLRVSENETMPTSDVSEAIEECFAARWADIHGDAAEIPEMPDPAKPVIISGYHVKEELSLRGYFFHALHVNAVFDMDVRLNNCLTGRALMLDGCEFRGSLHLSGARIGGSILARRTNFRGEFKLNSAKIYKAAHFSRSTFWGKSNFLDCRFLRGAGFQHVHFKESTSFKTAYFRKEAAFNHAHFHLVAVFDHARFLDRASFYDNRFNSDSSFASAYFKRDATFEKSQFSKLTLFDAAKFQAEASFRKIYSDGLMSFRGRIDSKLTNAPPAHFGTHTLFSEAHIKGRANFFQRCMSHPGKPGTELTFANAILEGPVSFEDAKFPHVLPVLSNTSLPQSTRVTAEDANWPDITAPPPYHYGKQPIPPQMAHRHARDSAAALRHAMARQALPEEEHFFFRREMHHAARMVPWWRSLHIHLFEQISNFGYSIMRPLIGLALVVVTFWLAYTFQFANDAVRSGGTQTTAEALALSFANTFSFFGFQRLYFGVDYIQNLPIWMRAAGAAQTVLGFVLLFFLGLGLRTRFRLR